MGGSVRVHRFACSRLIRIRVAPLNLVPPDSMYSEVHVSYRPQLILDENGRFLELAGLKLKWTVNGWQSTYQAELDRNPLDYKPYLIECSEIPKSSFIYPFRSGGCGKYAQQSTWAENAT